ncbi:MAG: DUF3795 domain-containing protein [Candidatus Hodarchaeota archaeon]
MQCKGCRHQNGRIPVQIHLYGESHRRAAYECAKSNGHSFCGECEEFPCDHLHPYADKAGELPHNIKIFNHCLISKMGLEKWAKDEAGGILDNHFYGSWTL